MKKCRLKIMKAWNGNAAFREPTDQKKRDAQETDVKKQEENEYSDPESYDEEEEVGDPYLDEKNVDKPHMMPLYAERIRHVLMERENSVLLKRESFLEAQKGTDVTLEVRNRAVMFMIELCHACMFDPLTLSNAVFLLDSVLTKGSAQRSELKLMSAVCVWMSAKAHELAIPSLEDLNDSCKITKKGDYHPYEMWERKIFIAHNFDVMYPTVQFFLGRCLNYVDADSNVSDVAGFLSEVSLLSFRHNEFARSKLAFSIVLTAAALIDFPLRILFFMACAHLSDYSDVLSCCEFVLGLAQSVFEEGKSSTYLKHIEASSPDSALRKLRFDGGVLQRIRHLLKSTKLV